MERARVGSHDTQADILSYSLKKASGRKRKKQFYLSRKPEVNGYVEVEEKASLIGLLQIP